MIGNICTAIVGIALLAGVVRGVIWIANINTSLGVVVGVVAFIVIGFIVLEVIGAYMFRNLF